MQHASPIDCGCRPGDVAISQTGSTGLGTADATMVLYYCWHIMAPSTGVGAGRRGLR